MNKGKISKDCPHVFREWCMNCDDWRQPNWCGGHQKPVKKCVSCGKFLKEE